MSVKRLLDEIVDDFSRFPSIKEIMIENDTLVSGMNEDYLEELCNAIEDGHLNFTWSANARADLTNGKLLGRLKGCGLRMLCVGYEFGSQELLDAVKKNVTLDQMREFTRLAKSAGIKINSCFMFGAPGETHETCRKTIEFAKELDTDTAQFSAMVPYPGTPFYEQVKNHIVAKDWPEWVDENYEQATVLSYPNLSKDDINSYINTGLKEFYGSLFKKARLISSVRSVGDVKRMVHGARAYRESVR